MKKSTKYILIALVAMAIIGQFLPKTKEEIQKPFNYQQIKSFQDISKKFFHCRFLVSIDEVKNLSKDELIKKMQSVAETETCGEARFYLNLEAEKAQGSSIFNEQNPGYLKDYIGKFDRNNNAYDFNQDFLDFYKIQ